LHSSDGNICSLKDLKGKKVILYFYPKDDTPGCTIEAKDFSEKFDAFTKRNTVIWGISKDSGKSHKKFCSKYDLKVRLLSDESTEMMQSYGVWQEKKNYGRTYMGTVRTTFLIDEEGTIQKIWRNVRVKGHVDEVLKAMDQK
tara:strand:- start:3283 stop:3708 length:426 start_codon:yes stop_codon:yes gene_type:complete